MEDKLISQMKAEAAIIQLEHEEIFYSHQFYLCGGQEYGFEDEEKRYTINDIIEFLRNNCENPNAVCWIADMLER